MWKPGGSLIDCRCFLIASAFGPVCGMIGILGDAPVVLNAPSLSRLVIGAWANAAVVVSSAAVDSAATNCLRMTKPPDCAELSDRSAARKLRISRPSFKYTLRTVAGHIPPDETCGCAITRQMQAFRRRFGGTSNLHYPSLETCASQIAGARTWGSGDLTDRHRRGRRVERLADHAREIDLAVRLGQEQHPGIEPAVVHDGGLGVTRREQDPEPGL